MIPLAIAFLLALALSAFLTAAELALFSLGEARIRTLVDEGYSGSDALAELREHPERLLVLLRLGTSIADVAAAAFAAILAYTAWYALGLALAIGVVALLVLLVAKLIPMRIAVHHGVRLALASAPALLAVARALNFIVVLLERAAQAVLKRETEAADSMAETQLRQLTALGRMEGVTGEHERQLIERAFRLDETDAWNVMTPRVDVFAWDDALTLARIATQLRSVSYSRVPVYGESIDDITGVLYLRDVYQALITGQRDVSLGQLARDPLTVPGSISLTTLLREFQTRHVHLAVVVDEYGGTDGVITLEDILEELVGEIVDETDIAEEPIVRVSRSEIVAAGDADLREINHAFNTTFPQLEHRSLNGYLLEELGRVPERGDRLERGGITLEVLDATDTQVARVRLRRTAPLAEVVRHRAGEPEAAAAAGPSAAPAEPAERAGAPAPRPEMADGDGERTEGPRAVRRGSSHMRA